MELETVSECLDEEPRAGVLSAKSRLRVKEVKEEKVAVAGKKVQADFFVASIVNAFMPDESVSHC